MTSGRRGRLLLAGLLVAGALAALLTAIAGFVLADVYHPQRRDAWWDVQRWAGLAFVVTSLAATVLALRDLLRADARRRAALVLVGAVVALLLASVTLLTQSLVAWDLLALREVVVGTDVHGYWTAAFDDEVVFVIVGDAEASKAEYGLMLVIHLGAPIVGAALLIAAAVALLRMPDGAGDPAPA